MSYEGGCYNLWVLYLEGQGVKKDYKKANELFLKACEANYARSCYNLGVSYANGQDGVELDYKKASELYSKACDMGLKQGCDNYKILSK